MSKFNAATGRTSTGPLVIERTPSTVTAEGGAGYLRDAKSELFMLAVSNMVGEDTVYEGASERDQRFRDLVRAVSVTDPEWTAKFITWLRDGANIKKRRRLPSAAGPAGRRWRGRGSCRSLPFRGACGRDVHVGRTPHQLKLARRREAAVAPLADGAWCHAKELRSGLVAVEEVDHGAC